MRIRRVCENSSQLFVPCCTDNFITQPLYFSRMTITGHLRRISQNWSALTKITQASAARLVPYVSQLRQSK